MSDSDSDSEGDKIRRMKRSVVVKFKFDDTDSSGDSDSDGPAIKPSTSRGHRKLSSSENNGSSGSDIKMRKNRGTKQRKAKPYIDDGDSDETSDSSWSPFEGASVNDTATAESPMPSATAKIIDDEVSSSTDSGDDLVDKCPICLHTFRDQEVGTPNVCEHNYCAPCIDEWSRNVQTCPIDRQPFTSIRVRSRYENGQFLREIAVQAETTELKTEVDLTFCEVCNRADREETMLLCDGCNQGYHMECLIPTLAVVPEGSWYCDNCFGSDSSEDDISQLIEEMEMEIGVPETRLRVRRVTVPRITRTRQSERIRTTILNRRREVDTVSRTTTSVVDISMPGIFGEFPLRFPRINT